MQNNQHTKSTADPNPISLEQVAKELKELKTKVESLDHSCAEHVANRPLVYAPTFWDGNVYYYHGHEVAEITLIDWDDQSMRYELTLYGGVEPRTLKIYTECDEPWVAAKRKVETLIHYNLPKEGA